MCYISNSFCKKRSIHNDPDIVSVLLADGRPIYLIRLGTMDIKGLLRSVGEEGFVKQVCWGLWYNVHRFLSVTCVERCGILKLI